MFHRPFKISRLHILLVVALIRAFATPTSVIAGDSLATSPPVPRVARVPVVFDVSIINWATGFACHGMCIDSAGNVHVYDCTALRDSLRLAESDERRAVLWATRFGYRDTIPMHIDTLELNAYERLIPKAVEEHVGPRRQVGADMGSTTFTAYWAAAPDSIGHSILLGNFGDWTTARDGVNTTKLVAWLKQIEAELLDLIFPN
jgi:hypothetical protein